MECGGCFPKNSHWSNIPNFNFWFVLMNVMHLTSSTSFTQPKLSLTAEWARDGITLTSNVSTNYTFSNIFIDENNTIYTTATMENFVLIWLNGDDNITKEISAENQPTSIFLRTNSLYIAVKNENEHIVKRFANESQSVEVTNVNDSCRSLFIDSENTLYCSMEQKNQVMIKPLSDDANNSIVYVGGENVEKLAKHLNSPKGIFVAKNFSLYVADFQNSRIQMFQKGSADGVTVAQEEGSLPVDIALDASDNLYILEQKESRLVRIGSTGRQCIVACSQAAGPESNRLNMPYGFSFDTNGNIYVADQVNKRVQKFALTRNTDDISYNRPKLCPLAIWNSHGVTVCNQSTCGSDFWSLFVDIRNNLYVNARSIDKILILFSENAVKIREINTTWDKSQASIFADIHGDIYIDSGGEGGYDIQKWPTNSTNHTVVMRVYDRCYGLFLDVNQNIYCSQNQSNTVRRRNTNDSTLNGTIIAGNGTRGSDQNLLNQPLGIFVTEEFHLYVADCGNDRVQLFKNGEKNGSTVAGAGAANPIDLKCPAAIVLDSDNYLFIADYGNHRIIGSGPNGFRCIIGCTGSSGSKLDQLNNPTSLSFDRDENLFVVDHRNDRIQKFDLIKKLTVSYNKPSLSSSVFCQNNGIVFLNESQMGVSPTALFIDNKDNLYLLTDDSTKIRIWSNVTTTRIHNISYFSGQSRSIFVTSNHDIYLDIMDGNNYRIDRIASNSNYTIPVLYAPDRCFSIFVDIDQNIYCSMNTSHQIIKRSTCVDPNRTTIVAGNGTPGSQPNMLNTPLGIFVTETLHLYVADCGNDRVQLFHPGETTGIPVLGNHSNQTIILHCPAGIIVDGDGNLFVIETFNHRIIRSNANGSTYIIGSATEYVGSGNILHYPTSISFDSVGNLFVLHHDKRMIVKYMVNDSCDSSFPHSTLQSSTIMNRSLEEFISPTISASKSSRITTFPHPSEKQSTMKPLASYNCLNASQIGVFCNTSAAPCDVIQPCSNNGTCINAENITSGYFCICPMGFSGVDCKLIDEVCQSDPCHNDGTCTPTSHRTFQCQCSRNWTGHLCHIKVNFCHQITCFNNGQCRPLIGDYRCECLSDRYSGRHCEKVSGSIILRQKVAKSFAYVAVIAIGTVAAFIIVLDVLKYGFGIDPVGSETEEKKKKNAAKKRPKRKRRC